MPIPLAPPRPPLAKWLFDRNLSIRKAAVYFETNPETLRQAILPFDDRLSRVPHRDLMRRIIERTGGEITADDWFPEAVA